MLGGSGGLGPLVNDGNLQISTFAIVFFNILCKNPLVILIALHHCSAPMRLSEVAVVDKANGILKWYFCRIQDTKFLFLFFLSCL